MARPDWRSASAYEELRPLDAPAFAYEFLCRNPEFLADHARLARKGRARALDTDEKEEFSKRWGVRFPPNHRQHKGRDMGALCPPDSGDLNANSGGPRRS
jgi:hypothetical protein